MTDKQTRRIMVLAAIAVPVFITAGAALAAEGPDGERSSWRLDPSLTLSGRVVTAESAARFEDETIDGTAWAVRLAPSLELANDDVTLTFRNATTRLEFRDADRTDRWQNTARLSGRFALGDESSVTVFGERADNMLSAEFSLTDEWEAGGEFEYAPDKSNRIQLGGSWRERSYDDGENSSGRGPRVDAEYRYRFGANHYAYLRGRYDEISSDNPRREVTRWLASASYQYPLAQDIRIRPEVSYQKLDYRGRPVAAGGFRSDKVLSPELTILYSPGPWQVSAEARYIIRSSTDPQFDRSGYRLALEMSYDF